jgi:hypothetical protein
MSGGADPNDLVVILGIDEDDGRCLRGLGQAVDMVDLHGQDVAVGGVPGDGLTLANVAEEMVLGAGGDLLDLELQRLPTGRRQDRAGEDHRAAGSRTRTTFTDWMAVHFCSLNRRGGGS